MFRLTLCFSIDTCFFFKFYLIGLNEKVISSSYSGIEELKKLCNSCRGCEVSFMSCSVNKLDSIDNRECSQAKMYSNTFRRKLAAK